MRVRTCPAALLCTLLASLGVVEVTVLPRPRVGVLSTGDELVEGNAPLKPGQIRESNRHTLLPMLAEAGCEPVEPAWKGFDLFKGYEHPRQPTAK